MIGTTLGHYRIVKKIGEGGMVFVVRAEGTKPVDRVLSLEAVRL